jgi:DNA-binding NarL/FixJ family response regulator
VIRVVVSARSSVVRAGLESVVRSSLSLELTGALDWALINSDEFEADVLLLDAGDTPADGFRVLADGVSGRLVLLLDSSDSALVSAALRSGIRGVLSREATPEEIESAIQAVQRGPGCNHRWIARGASAWIAPGCRSPRRAS